MFTTVATEGHQGVHRFFTTSMRWGELDHVLVFPDQLEAELDEDERMQRGLTKGRLKLLIEYLNDADDHFFSALTLVILPRDISRAAVEADDEVDDEWDFRFERLPLPNLGRQRPGKLELTGDVRLFPADGQHRAKSAMQALAQNHALAREEVPVVLVPYQSPEQVRQMFSDLNLNAKPVNRTIGLAFEQRDPLARIAKEVANLVPLFRGRVNRVNNSLPASSVNVITLNTLVAGTREILRALAKQRSLDVNPDDTYREYVKDVESAARAVADVFEVIVDAFTDEWEPVFQGVEGAAGKLRDEYLFAHGLGWQALAKAAARLIQNDDEGEWASEFIRKVHSLDWERTAQVWQGKAVIFNEQSEKYRVNNTGPAIDTVAKIIIDAV